MNKNTYPSLMPKIGGRAHRILVELSRHPDPMKEEQLMEAHGLDCLAPTIWRQGPYRQLVSDCLIQKLGEDSWALTSVGRLLMDEVEDCIVRGAVDEDAAPAPGIAQPRTSKPFTPLKVLPTKRPIRDGAYDYRDIPSLHSTLSGRSGK